MNIAALVDIGVVAILLISAGVSFFRGFIREVLTIIGVLGGGFAALTFGNSIVPLTSKWFGIEDGKKPEKIFDLIPADLAAEICAYAGIFLLVFMILQLVSYLVSRTVQAVGLGPIDRTLGIFFGLARGLLLLGILYLPFHFILPEDSKKEWFEKSRTMIFVEGTTNWLMSFAPSNKDSNDAINKTKEKLSDIDILGDKRISSSSDQNNDKNSIGYSDKTREGLENLIENKIDSTRKKYNE